MSQQQFKKDDSIELDEEQPGEYADIFPQVAEQIGKGPFSVLRVRECGKRNARHTQQVTILCNGKEKTFSGVWFKLAA